MLIAKVEITRIDYEKCVRSLLERFQTKLQGWSNAGLLGRLLEKLGESAPDVFCCLMSYIPDKGKGMLISELANHYRERLTEASNKALAANDLGKNIRIGEIEFGVFGEQLFICAQNVKVNYGGIMSNENVRKKVEDTAQQYLEHSALGKKLPGMGNLLKGKVSSAARFAATMAPKEIEKRALQYLATSESKAKLCCLLEEMLFKEGLSMEIGEISILKMEANQTINDKNGTDEPISLVQSGESAAGQNTEGRSVPLLSEETEELLLDALAEYLKSSVYGGQGNASVGKLPENEEVEYVRR